MAKILIGETVGVFGFEVIEKEYSFDPENSSELYDFLNYIGGAYVCIPDKESLDEINHFVQSEWSGLDDGDFQQPKPIFEEINCWYTWDFGFPMFTVQEWIERTQTWYNDAVTAYFGILKRGEK